MRRPVSAHRHGAAFGLVALLSSLGGCGDADRPAAAGGDSGAPVAVPTPAAADSLAPRLAAGPGGIAVLSWLEPDGEGHALKHSRWLGAAWSAPQQVARGDDWTVSQADLPAVVPIDAEHWVAHWLVTSPAGFLAYDIAVAVSADRGRSWSEPTLLNDDRTATEHGFVSWFPWNGTIGGVWLDGRNFAAEPVEGEEAALVGTTLRYARLDYGGKLLEQGVVDAVACDCCQTDVAIGSRGPLVVYRDRTAEERRDVVARGHDGGRWSEPLELGPDDWIIEGCPVNGPAVDAAGTDVAAAWFTAPSNRPRIRAALSRDGGASFSPAIDVDGSGSFGHVGVALIERGTAVVSWWRSAAGGGTDLIAQALASDGTLGERRIVAHAAASRPSDVPQMLAVGGRLLFAWTDDGAVHTAYLDWP